VPVIVSGGLDSAASARHAYEASGADAVMIARGSFGDPWIFEELTGARDRPPEREEIAEELLWVVARAEEHLGEERASRYLRKFYPWYAEALGIGPEEADAFQRLTDLDQARERIAEIASRAPR
jgi:tRNA-dihydrouridine synthase B